MISMGEPTGTSRSLRSNPESVCNTGFPKAFAWAYLIKAKVENRFLRQSNRTLRRVDKTVSGAWLGS